jgi:hypothetical protein
MRGLTRAVRRWRLGVFALVMGSAVGCSKGGGSNGPGAGASRLAIAKKNGPWDWNGVIGTGQSLSVGVKGAAVILAAQPFGNLKLSLGDATVTDPPYRAGDPQLALVPLVEPIRGEARGYPSAYPLNIYGETPHTAMADEISALSRARAAADFVTVHSVVGESGQPLSVIEKGAASSPDRGHAFAASLFEVAAIARLASDAGKTYGVGAVILTHGEADAANASYEQGILRLADDYNAGVRAITGQEQLVPVLLTQQHTMPGGGRTRGVDARAVAGRARPTGLRRLRRAQVPVPVRDRRAAPDGRGLRPPRREVRRGLLPAGRARARVAAARARRRGA